MADFEKTLLDFLAGKPPEEGGSIEEFDLSNTFQDNPAMLKRNLTIITAGVFMDKKNNVLLIQEAKSSCHGQWYLPAGRLDENETIEEGAKREVKEEAGVDFEPTSLICVECFPNIGSSWIRFTYTGSIVGGKLKTTDEADKESLQAKWFPADEIQSRKSELTLRAHDVLQLIDTCKTHQRLAENGKQIPPILPKLQHQKYMCYRLMLVRNIKSNFDVLISMNGSSMSHLPVIKDFGCDLNPTYKKIFGECIDDFNHKAVLCVEHAGKSREIYADGVCLTILVFTTTKKEPKDSDSFLWHRLRNETLIASLDKRLKRHENNIPLLS